MEFTKTQIIGALFGRFSVGIVITLLFYLIGQKSLELNYYKYLFISLIIFYWLVLFYEFYLVINNKKLYWQDNISGFISSVIGNLLLGFFIAFTPSLIGINYIFLIGPSITLIVLLSIFIISTKNYFENRITNIKNFIKTNAIIKEIKYSNVKINHRRLINLKVEFQNNITIIKNLDSNIGLNYSKGDKIKIKYNPLNKKQCILDK